MKSNEKGYALLTVLLLVMLFSVLGMGLIAMNTNASKQLNMKEEQVQARHLAEMGLLHYKSEVVEAIKDYKFVASKDSEDIDLVTSRGELCNLLKGIGGLDIELNEGSYEVPAAQLNCDTGDAGIISITMLSTGSADGEINKLVEGKLEITPPEIIESSPNPEPNPANPNRPVNNTGNEPITSYPAPKHGQIEVGGFMEVDGTFTIDKNALHYESFIINPAPSGQNALAVTGGNNGVWLKVEKDLYVDGIFIYKIICASMLKGI